MKIFVINLPEDVDRKNSIERQLQKLGLSYEIFPAIRGKLLSNQEKALYYDEKWFVRRGAGKRHLWEGGSALQAYWEVRYSQF